MIRTLVEIQGGRVSIRETAAETTVTVTVDSETSEVEVGQAESSWRDSLNRDQLLTEIDRLEKGLEYWEKQYSEREAARAKLEHETTEAIQVLERQVVEYDRDRTTERDRADQNKAWAERAEANGSRLSAALVQAEKDRDRLAAKIQEINGAVYGPYIPSALKHPWTSWTEIQAVALANAVRNVRQAIVSPEPDTSQA